MKQQKYTPFGSLSFSSSVCAFHLHSAIVFLICLQYMYRIWEKSNDNELLSKCKESRLGVCKT